MLCKTHSVNVAYLPRCENVFRMYTVFRMCAVWFDGLCLRVLVIFGSVTVLYCAVSPDAGGAGHGLHLSGSGERGEATLTVIRPKVL